jgi:hypothetical protein
MSKVPRLGIDLVACFALSLALACQGAPRSDGDRARPSVHAAPPPITPAVEGDARAVRNGLDCGEDRLPDRSYGYYRFGPAQPLAPEDHAAIERALTRAKQTDLAAQARASALLALAEIHRRIGNTFEARSAALLALHLVSAPGTQGDPALVPRACEELERWAREPRICEGYSSVHDWPSSLPVRALCPAIERIHCPFRVGARERAEPWDRSECIERRECERDVLRGPACTARAFAASFGDLPEQDTEGCYDLAHVFGAKPPLHAEHLANLGGLSAPYSVCEVADDNAAYLRTLETSTLGATSSYVRMRAGLETCGSLRLAWARKARLYDLPLPGEPGFIDARASDAQAADAVDPLRGTARACPSR